MTTSDSVAGLRPAVSPPAHPAVSPPVIPPMILAVILATACLLPPAAVAEEKAASIPEAAVAALDSALEETGDESSQARRRLGLKRLLRDGEALLEGQPDAANRFEVLSILFRGQQALFELDDSPRNREAVLEVARRLAKAPDEYAALRLDADLLLSQAEAAGQGTGAEARGRALESLVGRYRGTPVEGRVLQIAMVIALELGDQRLVDELRETMGERFPTDLEMVSFQRDKLAGQVLGVPFCGVYERSDGRMLRFPMDLLGRSVQLVFWSKENGLDDLQGFAAGWKGRKDDCKGRIEIVSFNLDDLPDAGAGILRDLGVDWPALKFPGGRDTPLYRAYVRNDPRRVVMSPTGLAALVMAGSGPTKTGTAAAPDYAGYFNSALARHWTLSPYVNQVASIVAGDFFVVDPTAPFDPALPPEVKAASFGRPGDAKLPRTAASVPAETLAAIQDCFLSPPRSYRATAADLRSRFEKAEKLCREAIAAHPAAADLWIVRNRRIIALMNLWKMDPSLERFDEAVAEARAALAADLPAGADVVARLCLAREALRRPDADPAKVIDDVVRSAGEDSAPALAAAALLALDAGDRGLHSRYRRAILERHRDNPMTWTLASFLLDRYHRCLLYEAPYNQGWSFDRRRGYAMADGRPDDFPRSVEVEFRTLDDQPFRIPQDAAGTWTIVVFWDPRSDDKLLPPMDVMNHLGRFAAGRPGKDVRCVAALVGEDAATLRSKVDALKPLFPVVTVPGGIDNPVVARLGVLAEEEHPSIVVVRPDGTIATVLSELALHAGALDAVVNVFQDADERAVFAAIERGELDKAKELAFTFAPPWQPGATDDKGRPIPKPEYTVSQLRRRARVYAALGEWDAALADAEEIVTRETGTAGWLSQRTAVLDEAERFRDECAARRDAPAK